MFLLQPQNLVLTGEFPDCEVKLCDFGISRYLNQGVDVKEINGTPDYVGKNKYLCTITNVRFVLQSNILVDAEIETLDWII